MRSTIALALSLSITSVAGVSHAAPDPTQVESPRTLVGALLDVSSGKERLVLDLDAPAAFRKYITEDGTQVLEVRSARISREARDSLRGLRGETIESVHVSESEGIVRIRVKASVRDSTAVRAGRKLIWAFDVPQVAPEVKPNRTVTREPAIETPEVAGFLTSAPVSGAPGRQQFAGRRIDLDFKDADIHNILRLISDVGGVNIVTTDDVSGTVTIRMRNVPWDEALHVILQAKGLGMVRRDNLIRVAPLATLEQEFEAELARRRAQVQLAPLETRIVPVAYAKAEDMAARARDLLSERGTVSVDSRTNVLIINDMVGNIEAVEQLVRVLDTQTPQVLIEARVVEATSNYSRDVGIQWGGDLTFTSATGNPTGAVFPNDIAVAGGNSQDPNTPFGGLSPFGDGRPTQNPNFAVNLPAVTGSGQGGALGVTLGSVGGNVNLAVRLSAAESKGVVRIISSPRILTLDNHEARISQGTLIPFSQVSAQGVQTTFQEAKLQLLVQPHVTADGSVSMHVKINRDEPDFNQTSPRGDPTILKREAETDLLVMDGNTAVIGGVYTRNTGRNVNQVPFFGDIPLLGLLFQRRNATDQRGELVIFLTPRIINRAQALGR